MGRSAGLIFSRASNSASSKPRRARSYAISSGVWRGIGPDITGWLLAGATGIGIVTCRCLRHRARRAGQDRLGRPDIGGDPIVVVLTQRVSDAHLAGLRQDGVSYIFAATF